MKSAFSILKCFFPTSAQKDHGRKSSICIFLTKCAYVSVYDRNREKKIALGSLTPLKIFISEDCSNKMKTQKKPLPILQSEPLTENGRANLRGHCGARRNTDIYWWVQEPQASPMGHIQRLEIRGIKIQRIQLRTILCKQIKLLLTIRLFLIFLLFISAVLSTGQIIID